MADVKLLFATIVLAALAADVAHSQTPPAEPRVSLYGVAAPEPSGTSGASVGEVEKAQGPAVPPSQKRGEFVVAPMPMINPTLDNGLFVITGYIYRLDLEDRTTPPSIAAVAGFKTSNGSWGGAVFQNLHFAHDRFRILGTFAYSDVNYDFHGIGQEAGESGLSIELNQAGPIAVADGLVRVAPKWYLGARYQILRMTVTTPADPIPGGPTLPALDAKLRTAALGPRLEFDSRDNAFYPRRGWHLQGFANFFGRAVGGHREYQAYQAWVNAYHGFGERHVLAWHAGACGVDGSVPFYDLCQLGKKQDLRGYQVGQFRDRAMVAAQAEWRTELWWRFGATALVGVGQVAPDFDRFTWRSTLPGGGAGVRFTLAKRNHLNLRVDYAWGKDSTAFYVGVAEAF